MDVLDKYENELRARLVALEESGDLSCYEFPLSDKFLLNALKSKGFIDGYTPTAGCIIKVEITDRARNYRADIVKSSLSRGAIKAISFSIGCIVGAILTELVHFIFTHQF